MNIENKIKMLKKLSPRPTHEQARNHLAEKKLSAPASALVGLWHSGFHVCGVDDDGMAAGLFGTAEIILRGTWPGLRLGRVFEAHDGGEANRAALVYGLANEDIGIAPLFVNGRMTRLPPYNRKWIRKINKSFLKNLQGWDDIRVVGRWGSMAIDHDDDDFHFPIMAMVRPEDFLKSTPTTTDGDGGVLVVPRDRPGAGTSVRWEIMCVEGGRPDDASARRLLVLDTVSDGG